MPSNYIKWRKILFGSEQLSTKLLHNSISWVRILIKPSSGGKEIPRRCQTISTYATFKHLLDQHGTWNNISSCKIWVKSSYQLGQDQVVENECRKFQQRNHVMNHQVSLLQNENLVE